MCRRPTALCPLSRYSQRSQMAYKGCLCLPRSCNLPPPTNANGREAPVSVLIVHRLCFQIKACFLPERFLTMTLADRLRCDLRRPALKQLSGHPMTCSTLTAQYPSDSAQSLVFHRNPNLSTILLVNVFERTCVVCRPDLTTTALRHYP
jgi:hypothetical protein